MFLIAKATPLWCDAHRGKPNAVFLVRYETASFQDFQKPRYLARYQAYSNILRGNPLKHPKCTRCQIRTLFAQAFMPPVASRRWVEG